MFHMAFDTHSHGVYIARMETKALEIAIKEAGGLSALASLLVGASPQMVGNWRTRGVPEGHCPGIEQVLDGKVTCEQLRPDVSWVRTPDKAWPHPKGRPLVDHSTKKAA